MSPASEEGNSSKYTAVLYFHGMGSQRRYEEISRLVDALDKFAHNASDKGILSNIRARLEPPRGEIKKDMSYLRVIHNCRDDKGNMNYKAFRFYEYYWAPITACGRPVGSVLKWLFRRMFTPFQTLSSPWRERQRLRQSVLNNLAWKTSLKYRWKKGEIDQNDLRKILLIYNKFEGHDARRDYPKGKFEDFKSYVKQTCSAKPDTAKRLLQLTHRWHSAYIRSELFNTLALMSLFLAIFVCTAAFAGLSYLILRWLEVMGTGLPDNSLFSSFGELVAPNFKNIASLLGLIASLLGIAGFLKNYLGDVEFWTTYEETDENYEKRKEILDKAFLELMHILQDGRCERVVIIGHSLGSAIAYDTLLEASRYNRARNGSDPIRGALPLDKIDHFITLASPIDKIHYFFESHRGKYHRYNRVVDEVRGDLGTVPFTRNRTPHTHWINFWDQGDIISGPLETPMSNRLPEVCVDNIHATNYLFPSPGACHSGYFNNSIVMEKIFEVIFQNKYSFQEAQVKPGKEGKDFESMLVGPGKFSRITPFLHRITVPLPWLIVITFGLHVAGIGAAINAVLQWLIYGIVATIAVFWSVSTANGHLHPLKKNMNGDRKIF